MAVFEKDGFYESKMNDLSLAKCSFCGDRPPAAYWAGETRVFVCGPCAEHVLPSLCADALIRPRGKRPPKWSAIRAAALAVTARFYVAALQTLLHFWQKES